MKFVATIGVFDGLHRGHRYLIDQLKETAKRHAAEPLVITFDRHPNEVLQKERSTAPYMLTTTSERVALLHDIGIAHVELLHFTSEVAHLTADAFARERLLPLGVVGLVMGFNHSFGSDRDTDFPTLQSRLGDMGIALYRAQPLRGGSDTNSTRIRCLLAEGQLAEANRLLGYDYMLSGTVEHGQHLGTTIGFPTANLHTPAEKLVPSDGVYIARAYIADEKEYQPAIVNIGKRPTVDAHGKRTIEAHLTDYNGNLYGQRLTLALAKRLRDERPFTSLTALREQLQKDAAACRAFQFS